ncbi:hypothetical protein HDU81_009807 [Chytriomyces hyalinus]|nr:hypothetical protein HDU81_009807 [Chytriomyces hyalinus]
MTYHTQHDSDISRLLAHLAKLGPAARLQAVNAATYIPPTPHQPTHFTAKPSFDRVHVILRLRPEAQLPQAPQVTSSVQNINEPDSDETVSESDSDNSHAGSDDEDTLSDFGSDCDNDAIWDQAMEDCESKQVQPPSQTEEFVDYLAMMEQDLANNAAALPENLAGRENTHWEERWNIAEEVMLGEIAFDEMGRYDPDEEIYSWEYKLE